MWTMGRTRPQDYRERKNSTAGREKVTRSTPRRTGISSGLANVISHAAVLTRALAVLACALALHLRIRHGHLRCHPRHHPSRAPSNHQSIRSPFSTIARALLRHHHLPYSVSPSLLGRVRRINLSLPHKV